MTHTFAVQQSVTHSDPILCANIYASGLLDDLLASTIAPLWREARQSLGDRFGLWLVRYSRGGEHLKVRLHGDVHDAPLIRQIFADRINSYLRRVRLLPDASPRVSAANVPAIDPEDESGADCRDRSFIWTTYRRSPVTMASPWLELEGCAQRSYDCMVRGSEWVLAVHEARPPQLTSARWNVLIRAVLLILPALGLDRADAVDYLTYQRDWLLRFLCRDAIRQDAALERLSEEVSKRAGAIEQIRRLMSTSAEPERNPADYGVRFAATVNELAGYLKGCADCIDREADPFASSMIFPPVFKVMHNLANQLGIRPFEEAYIYHLVLAATAAEMESELAMAGSGATS